MRALMMKELSEHLRWSALAGLAFLVVIIATQGMWSHGSTPTLTDGELLHDVALAGMAWGVMLGLLQNLRDGRREWLGLLMHRPVTVGAIVRAKLLSGLILYAITILIPVLVVCCWLSRPAPHRAPFMLASVLPILVSGSLGLGAYLAASHVAVRHARWWATRVVPLLFALTAVACLAMQSLTLTLVAIAAMLVLQSSLVFGWFRSQGRDADVSWWPRLCWSVCALALMGMAVLFLVHQDSDGESERGAKSRYVLDAAGRAVVRHLEAGKEPTYTGVDQQPLTEEPNLLPTISVAVDAHPERSREVPSAWWRPQTMELAWYDAARYGLLLGSDHEVEYYWRELTHQLIACSGSSGRILGFVTPQGVVAHPVTGWTSWHQGYSELGQTFLHGQDIYTLDPVDGRLRLLLAPAPGEQVTGIYPLNTWITRHPFWICTNRRLVMVAFDGALLQRCPLPALAGTAVVQIAIAGPPGHIAMLFNPYDHAHAAVTEASQVVSYDGHGQVRSVQVLPLLPMQTVVTNPPPLWSAVTMPTLALCWGFEPRAAVLTVLSTLLALGVLWYLAWRWRWSASAHLAWSALVALVGPLGVLIVLALRQGPPREPCPACHRLRIITREHCEYCGARFRAPEAMDIALVDDPRVVADHAAPLILER